jgi:hypothetical protein
VVLGVVEKIGSYTKIVPLSRAISNCTASGSNALKSSVVVKLTGRSPCRRSATFCSCAVPTWESPLAVSWRVPPVPRTLEASVIPPSASSPSTPATFTAVSSVRTPPDQLKTSRPNCDSTGSANDTVPTLSRNVSNAIAGRKLRAEVVAAAVAVHPQRPGREVAVRRGARELRGTVDGIACGGSS